jgi:vancomycin resistance protein VanW
MNIKRYVQSAFFKAKKKIYWNISNTKFATHLEETSLEYQIATHKTPLYRKLKDVDMHLQENKVTNLKIAIQNLNGMIIQPGEILSYWKQIGNPTKSKGYLEGMYLDKGNVKTATGGGLCQLSNIIYWTALHTPLDIIERWRHIYDVFPDSNRTQPFGSGATCAYPNIDLQIKNSTDSPFQLVLAIDDEYLYAKWFSDKPTNVDYEIIEKNHKITTDAFGHYMRQNEIYKRITKPQTKAIIAENFVTANQAYMMYEPLLTA